jgi:hypothetical protein
MNLHGPFAFADSKGVGAQDSHRKVMGAAEEIVAIAHSFEKIPEIYWHVAIQVNKRNPKIQNIVSPAPCYLVGWVGQRMRSISKRNYSHPGEE